MIILLSNPTQWSSTQSCSWKSVHIHNFRGNKFQAFMCKDFPHKLDSQITMLMIP